MDKQTPQSTKLTIEIWLLPVEMDYIDRNRNVRFDTYVEQLVREAIVARENEGRRAMNLPKATRGSATHMLTSLQSKARKLERLLEIDAITTDELIDKTEILTGLAILLEREARSIKITHELLKRQGASANQAV